MILIGRETIAMLSAPELLVIAIVLLLLFGGKKIPDLARGLGLGIRNFKSSIKNEEEAEEKEEQK